MKILHAYIPFLQNICIKRFYFGVKGQNSFSKSKNWLWSLTLILHIYWDLWSFYGFIYNVAGSCWVTPPFSKNAVAEQNRYSFNKVVILGLLVGRNRDLWAPSPFWNIFAKLKPISSKPWKKLPQYLCISTTKKKKIEQWFD